MRPHVCAILPACVLAVAAAAPAADNPDLLTVAGRTVSLADFESRVALLEKTQPGQPPATPERKRALIEQLIRHEVFFEAARGEKLDAATERQLEMLRQSLMVKQYIAGRLAASPVGEQEIAGYYDANPAQFAVQETRKLSHVIVKTEEEAKAAAAEVRGGKDLAVVARQVNLDRTKTRGGDLGWVPRGRMVPEFEKEAFSLAKGAVGGPFRTQFGWHLVRVDDIRPAGRRKLDEVRTEIKARLEQLKVMAIEDQLKARFKVTVNTAALDKIAPARPPAPAGGAK